MNDLAVTLVPSAIGLALSPVPIVELILVLFSKRRATNALAFVAALLVLSAAALVVGALGGQAGDRASGSTSPVLGWVFVALGAVLLLLGIQNWRNRADTSEPPVLATISGMGPAAVAFLALGATWVNPKNTVLLLTAGSAIGRSDSPILVGALFLLVATAPYTLAAAYALLGGQPAQAKLDTMRGWLVARNRLIMGVICTLMGLLLLAKGLGALA